MINHHTRCYRRTSRMTDKDIDAYTQCLHQRMQAVGHAAHGHALACGQ